MSKRNCLIIDIETELIGPLSTGHPRFIVGGYKKGDGAFKYTQNKEEYIQLIKDTGSRGATIVGHNISFDLGVLGFLPNDIQEWSVHDTGVVDLLHRLATTDCGRDKPGPPRMRKLTELAKSHIEGKGTTQLSFRAGIPLTQEQVDYLGEDIAATERVFLRQGPTSNQVLLQVRSSMALSMLSHNGVRVDNAAIVQQRIEYTQKKKVAAGILQKAGIYKPAWEGKRGGKYKASCKIVPFKEHILSLYKAHGLTPEYTDKGNLKTDRISLRALPRDAIAEGWLEYKGSEKILSTFLAAWDTPGGRIHPRYRSPMRTGRTSCIAKGTKIDIVRDCSKHPDGINIEDVKEGDMVYCYDNKCRLRIKPVMWAGCTGKREVIRVHWQGTGRRTTGYLDLTPEHKIRLFNGQYVRADQLLPSVSVLALSRGDTGTGYLRLYPTHMEPILEHKFISEELQNRGAKQVTHHIITRIEHINTTVEVYDIHVKDHHNFIAAGINVHNSHNPNLQQIPSKGGLKRIFLPEKGMSFYEIDYNQLELCCLAQLTQGCMLNKINAGEDLHKYLASVFHNKSVEDVIKDERQLAKQANFGLPGGMGTTTFRKLVRSANMDDPGELAARQLKNAWLQAYPEMEVWLQDDSKIPWHLKNVISGKKQGEARIWEQIDALACDINLPPKVRAFLFAQKGNFLLERWLSQRSVIINNRKRFPVSYTEAHNCKFQAMAADLTKNALCGIIELKGVIAHGFIHDSFLVSTTEMGIQSIIDVMLEAADRHLPSVRVGVSVEGPGVSWFGAKEAGERNFYNKEAVI